MPGDAATAAAPMLRHTASTKPTPICIQVLPLPTAVVLRDVKQCCTHSLQADCPGSSKAALKVRCLQFSSLGGIRKSYCAPQKALNGVKLIPIA